MKFWDYVKDYYNIHDTDIKQFILQHAKDYTLKDYFDSLDGKKKKIYQAGY